MSEDRDTSADGSASTDSGTQHTAGAFDIRTFIAALMGIFGVILVLTGIFGGNETTIGTKADGNPNLYVGIALIVFSAGMAGWAMLRPTIVDEERLAKEKSAQDGPG